MHLPLGTTALLVAALILSGVSPCEGCPLVAKAPPPAADEQLEICRRFVKFEFTPRPSFAGFQCVHTIGKVSIWHHPETNDFLVADFGKFQVVKVSGIPECTVPSK